VFPEGTLSVTLSPKQILGLAGLMLNTGRAFTRRRMVSLLKQVPEPMLYIRLYVPDVLLVKTPLLLIKVLPLHVPPAGRPVYTFVPGVLIHNVSSPPALA
jgi:hypothetical protein